MLVFPFNTTVCWLLLLQGPPQPTVTFAHLLREVVDLDGITRWPDPPFVTRQFSSRDRLSDDPRNPETWFAGQDRGHALYDGTVTAETPFYKEFPAAQRPPDGSFAKGTRIGLARQRTQGEFVWAYATAPDGGPMKGTIPQGYIRRGNFLPNTDGHVLAEMNGPGCLVRFWSANPSEGGGVRIYLDDAPEPVLTAPLQELLGGSWVKVIAGQPHVPFPVPLAGARGQGWTLLFPLPYQKRCKVVVEKPDLAYQIMYRTYPGGTTIDTFSWDLWAAHRKLIEGLAAHLARRAGMEPILPAQVKNLPLPIAAVALREATLTPGAQVILRDFQGSGCLERVELRLSATQPTEALRGLLLMVTFDDAPAPQVRCPLGDFFGTAPGANAYEAEPLAVGADLTLTSHWRMPFARKAVVTLANYSRQRVHLQMDTQVRGHDWQKSSLHFHAGWQSQPTLQTRPVRDWNVCHLRGQGVYVGTMLSVTNPVTSWWGEGNDKIYVDGEQFPSLFGTGTDAHFGFAFGHRQTFHHPLHNLTRCDGPGHYGHASMNRFLLLDRIPFTQELRFDLELRHWMPNSHVGYAVTCYWYARPGATHNMPAIQRRQLDTLPALPPLHRLAGAIEGEQLQVMGQSANFQVGPLEVLTPEHAWSDGAQLYAQPLKKGEWVDLAVPVLVRGKQRLILYLAQGPQYGLLRFMVNGKTINVVYEGFHASQTRLGPPLDLGIFDLEPGSLTLRIETTGAASKAIFPRYAWGLDAVLLKPVK